MVLDALKFRFTQLAEWDAEKNFGSAGRGLSGGEIATGTWLLIAGVLAGLVLVGVIVWLVKKRLAQGSPAFSMGENASHQEPKKASSSPSQAPGTPGDSRAIVSGSSLVIIHGLGINIEAIDVAVVDNTARTLVVTPEESQDVAKFSSGQEYVVRSSNGGTDWEFITTVIAIADGEIYLTHSRELKKTDRRKFPRTSTNIPAKIAGFIFLKRDIGRNVAPDFFRASLKQIAGPGLLLETSLKVNASQKVLVLLFFDEAKIVEATGIVRRIDPGDDGNVFLAIELIGLSPSELQLMVNETKRHLTKRVKTNFHTNISTSDDLENITEGLVVEVGQDSIVIETRIYVDVGADILAKIDITEAESIDIRGNVASKVSGADDSERMIVKLTGNTGSELVAFITGVMGEEYEYANSPMLSMPMQGAGGSKDV